MAGPNAFRSIRDPSRRPYPRGASTVDGAPSGAVIDAATAASPHPPLHLPAHQRAAIEQLARAGYPHEACGLLLGRLDRDATRLARVTHARNLATDRLADRYTLDPQDYLAADEEARRDGLEIVGIWHSHPDHPARPSATDLRNAWPDYTYLIVAVHQGEVVDLTAWRLDASNFIQQTIEEDS